jgi:type II secretory pathway pseudopilin PulG
LLEVLLALTIFLLSMIAIGQLIILAGERAVEIELEGQATQLCQSKLAEVVSGAVPLSSQADVPFEEDPAWQWSVEAEQGNVAGLWRVVVEVTRTRPDGTKLGCRLTQLLLDPGLRGTSLAAPAAPAGSTSSGTSSTSPTSSSSGSSGSSTGKGGPQE